MDETASRQSRFKYQCDLYTTFDDRCVNYPTLADQAIENREGLSSSKYKNNTNYSQKPFPSHKKISLSPLIFSSISSTKVLIRLSPIPWITIRYTLLNPPHPSRPHNIMRRPIHASEAERKHLLLAYQTALAEHQAFVAREQQLLEEIEAREIYIEADTIARDAFLADTGRDADSAATTPYCRPAQKEASSAERHLLRMSLELIGGGRCSMKDEYMYVFLFITRFEFSISEYGLLE
jgi:hypothetical protein